MESLANFLLWAGFFFLLLHFGRGAHVMGDRHRQRGAPEQGLDRNPKQLGWTAPKIAVDAVCGKTVQTNAAKSSVDDGAVHYFCSRECRERFEVAPNLYLGQLPEAAPEEMGHDRG
jgi:YHS domain-containing protein